MIIKISILRPIFVQMLSFGIYSTRFFERKLSIQLSRQFLKILIIWKCFSLYYREKSFKIKRKKLYKLCSYKKRLSHIVLASNSGYNLSKVCDKQYSKVWAMHPSRFGKPSSAKVYFILQLDNSLMLWRSNPQRLQLSQKIFCRCKRT